MYNVFKIALGIFFIVLGLCDICKVKLPFGYSSKMRPTERELWQRWVGIVEAILGVCEISFVFVTGLGHVSSILLAVLIISSVCILGPYYHWRNEHKDDSDGQ